MCGTDQATADEKPMLSRVKTEKPMRAAADPDFEAVGGQCDAIGRPGSKELEPMGTGGRVTRARRSGR